MAKRTPSKPALLRLATLSPEDRAERLVDIGEVLSSLLLEKPYARAALAAVAEPLTGVHRDDIASCIDELVVKGEIHEIDDGLLELTEADDGPACCVCRCTQNNACAEGCGWDREAAKAGDALCTVCADFVEVLAHHLERYGPQSFTLLARSFMGEPDAEGAPEDLDENRLRATLVYGATRGRFVATNANDSYGPLPPPTLDAPAWALLERLAKPRRGPGPGGLARYDAGPAKALKAMKLARVVAPGKRLVITVRGRRRHAAGRNAR